MTLQQIINLARTLTYTTEEQIPDGDINSGGVLYANLAYKDLVNTIQQFVDEEYFLEKFTGDLVIDQNRYALPKLVGETPGLRKIVGIEIDLNSDGNFKSLRPSSISEIHLSGYTLEYLRDNQPISDPIYIIKDNEVEIFPTPKKEAVGGLIFYGLKDVVDLGLADTPDIPSNHHQLIAMGMKPYIFAQRGLWQEKEASVQEYYREKENFITQMDTRKTSPIEKTLPNLTRFE